MQNERQSTPSLVLVPEMIITCTPSALYLNSPKLLYPNQYLRFKNHAIVVDEDRGICMHSYHGLNITQILMVDGILHRFGFHTRVPVHYLFHRRIKYWSKWQIFCCFVIRICIHVRKQWKKQSFETLKLYIMYTNTYVYVYVYIYIYIYDDDENQD